MRYSYVLILVLALVLSACTVNLYNKTVKGGFDAVAAWAEFENEVRQKYAYLDASCGTSVEAQLARSRTLALKTKDRRAFRLVLHQTALTFCDPHFNVGPFADDDFSIVMTGADMAVDYHQGRFIVADVRQHSAAYEAGVRPGWEILRINNIAAREAAQDPFGPVLPNPNPEQLSFGATIAASGRVDRDRRFAFSHHGENLDLRLAHPYVHMNAHPTQGALSAKRLKDIGLIRLHNSLGDNGTIKAFDEAVRALEDTRAIILDLRNTPSGGNTEVARSIIGHFIAEPRAYQMHTIPSIARDYGVPRQFVEYALPRDPHFDGPLIILHGRWTGSMGEGLVIGLDAARDAYSIGSDMGDLLGALWNIDLPTSKVRIDIGGEALFHVNGTPREDFIADKALKHADTDVDGTDPALKAALAYLQQ